MGSNAPPSPELIKSAVESFRLIGNKSECAKQFNVPRGTFTHWLDIAARTMTVPLRGGPQSKGRRVVDLENGVVIVAADFHYQPGDPSTAHRALVRITKELKPDVLVANGDVCDFGSVSRHPPLGWKSIPTAEEEIEEAQERLQEWAEAGGKAQKYWPIGNHDSRLEVFIASRVPELKGIAGTSLCDHFPLWEPCYSVFINDRPGGLVIKHRYRSGIHAPHNNVINAGRSIATGHLHSQKVMPFTNYEHTLYGIDVGCIAEPYADAFEYMEDNPRNWRSGFCVFTFENGVLLPPELVTKIRPVAGSI